MLTKLLSFGQGYRTYLAAAILVLQGIRDMLDANYDAGMTSIVAGFGLITAAKHEPK